MFPINLFIFDVVIPHIGQEVFDITEPAILLLYVSRWHDDLEETDNIFDVVNV